MQFFKQIKRTGEGGSHFHKRGDGRFLEAK